MATASLAIQGAPKKKPEGLDLYWRFALAGALGCSVLQGLAFKGLRSVHINQ
ncbi:hypothetical protein F4801DRAFT_573367 [Xylaria longipes]|nr:hypothetical protein F4801DRAFT_573367 [Xylaria longipes]